MNGIINRLVSKQPKGFCPTGQGGGVDNTCGTEDGGGSSAPSAKPASRTAEAESHSKVAAAAGKAATAASNKADADGTKASDLEAAKANKTAADAHKQAAEIHRQAAEAAKARGDAGIGGASEHQVNAMIHQQQASALESMARAHKRRAASRTKSLVTKQPSGASQIEMPLYDREAIDFDGTIADCEGDECMDLSKVKPREGALEGMERISKAGIPIVIWTAHQPLDDVRVWLNQYGVAYTDIIPKIPAIAYIDDHAISSKRDWDEIADKAIHAFYGKVRQPEDNWDDLEKLAAKAQPEMEELLKAVHPARTVRLDDSLPLGELEAQLRQPGSVLVLPGVKSYKRAQEKVEDDYGGNWSKLLDINRASLAFDTRKDLDAAAEILRAAGKVARPAKDRFAEPLGNGYRDYLTNYRLPCGAICEVQLHLKPMLIARERVKMAYDVARAVHASLDAEGREDMTPAEAEAVRRARKAAKHIYAQAWQECLANEYKDTPRPVNRLKGLMEKGKDVTSMSAAQINQEMDKIDAESSKLTDQMIEAGRGHERPSDWQHKTDPLSLRMIALAARRQELFIEAQLRYGPGFHGRLPRGFGPRKSLQTKWIAESCPVCGKTVSVTDGRYEPHRPAVSTYSTELCEGSNKQTGWAKQRKDLSSSFRAVLDSLSGPATQDKVRQVKQAIERVKQEALALSKAELDAVLPQLKVSQRFGSKQAAAEALARVLRQQAEMWVKYGGQKGYNKGDAMSKPNDCTCPGYPRTKLRNGSGHQPSCPCHKRWEALGGFSNKDKTEADWNYPQKGDTVMDLDPALTLRFPVNRLGRK